MTLRETSQDQDGQHKRPPENAEDVPVKKRRRSKMKSLIDTWFECWKSTDESKKSDSKQIVTFMKLFLPNDYVLDKNADIFKEQVKQVGDQAAANLQVYPRENNISSSGSSAILKALRKLHYHGAFNEHIRAYRCLLAIGKIIDPAPAHYHDTLVHTQ
ncbi:Hypothetical protein PHPALM_13881 [Phytophthora palmivora]|uniref:Uncharacterized protein n=1 Tax=Phytophthora palmivora TaxID=4796 RepID=A0A2P4XW65_9STRA|nr:Hypothetical protein PHPALM_13881 [Phytophthora palmivora]